MKKSIYTTATLCFMALTTVIGASAQANGNERFALKASADFSLSGPLSVSSSLPGLTDKGSAGNYGLEFGCTFWKQQAHSLEFNIGLAYSPVSLSLDLSSLNYSYAAPAAADMDGNTYKRFYELSGINQKINSGYFTIPMYLTYAYRCNGWLGVHADIGFRFGFKTSGKLGSVSGSAYSYGVYPQYDNLKIDAPYLNDFGTSDLAGARYGEPQANGFMAEALIGIGVEFRIYGPLSADLSFRYNAGLTNIYKGDATEAANPVTYTVANGQQVDALSNYLTTSKIAMPSLRIALHYRF